MKLTVIIVVKDIKSARDFYENMLGQKVKYDYGENITISPAKWYYDELNQVGVDYADIKNVEEY